MYAIDTLVNANKYIKKQQIFDDLRIIVQEDLSKDLQKIILKSGGYIGTYWNDFLFDSIEKNKEKLQNMENDKTVEFWNADTSIKGALKIVQSMMRSEIQNAMDKKRGGKPLINVIDSYNITQLDDLKRGDDSAINQADAKMDAEKISELDPETFVNGLLKMAQNMIFSKDPKDVREDIEYLCKEYGFDYAKILPDTKAEFCKMLEDGEVKVDENNQMFFDF